MPRLLTDAQLDARMAGLAAREKGASWREAAKIAQMSEAGFRDWARRIKKRLTAEEDTHLEPRELREGERWCEECGLRTFNPVYCHACLFRAERGREAMSPAELAAFVPLAEPAA